MIRHFHHPTDASSERGLRNLQSCMLKHPNLKSTNCSRNYNIVVYQSKLFNVKNILWWILPSQCTCVFTFISDSTDYHLKVFHSPIKRFVKQFPTSFSVPNRMAHPTQSKLNLSVFFRTKTEQLLYFDWTHTFNQSNFKLLAANLNC